jgi:PHS family inorganic phosphate transporter-like MFS transporter
MDQHDDDEYTGSLHALRTPLISDPSPPPTDCWIMIRLEQEEIHLPVIDYADGENLNPSTLSPMHDMYRDGLLQPPAHSETSVTDGIHTTESGSAAAAQPWYSNSLQVTAMISNFSTSYNVVNISLVLPILEQLESNTTQADAAAVASSLLAGMIFGQIVGGALGDSWLGRLGALRLVMMLQIVASLGSALCVWERYDLYLQLSVWRFILGVGAGGVYPLAAILSAEQGNEGTRDKAIHTTSTDDSEAKDDVSLHRVVLTFSTQGAGFVAVPLVTVPLLYGLDNLALVWRIVLGLGSLPGIVLMGMQWRLHRKQAGGGVREAVPLSEPEGDMQEDGDGDGDGDGGEEDSDGEIGTILDSTPGDTENHEIFIITDSEEESLTDRRGWWDAIRHEDDLVRKLLGTAGTWFLFDVLFYGNTLFQPIVIEAAFGAREASDPLHLLQRTAVDSLILTSIALPGYAVAGFVMGKKTCGIAQTPRFVMLQGFAAMAVLYFIIGVYWKSLRHFPFLLLFLYGLTFFFANYGPNTSTFTLPSIVYSPECRSTLNGLSAAAGKLGALVGATLFAPASDSFGDATVMLICSGIAMVAFAMTKFFVRIRDESEPGTIL